MSEELSNFVLFMIAFYISQIHVLISAEIHIGVAKMTWYEANDWCHARGYDLISIHSDSEYTKIKSLPLDANYNYWTGLYHTGKPDNKSAYVWSDNTLFDYGQNFSFYPWNDIDPNSFLIPSCVRLQNTANHLWDDINCNSTKNGQKALPLCQETTESPTTSIPTVDTSALTLNTDKTQIPSDNTRIATENTRFPTAYIPTLIVDASHKEKQYIDSANATVATADAQLYSKENDELVIEATTYIIIVSGCVLGVCCMFVIGITLIKRTLKNHVRMQVRDGYKKGRVIQHAHERVETQSWNEVQYDHAVNEIEYEIKTSIELQLAENSALNACDDEVEDEHVTKGYFKDEPHDGIRSEIGDNEHDPRVSVLVSEGDVHRDGRTVGFENMEPDEFVIMGDDENEATVTKYGSAEHQHQFIIEGEQYSS